MKPFVYETRVYFEDTDINGMVFHTNYIKYFERARTEWLSAVGLSVSDLFSEGILFAILSVNIKFKLPARLDDHIDVHAWIIEAGKTRVKYGQKVVKRGEPDTVFCEGEVEVVCVNPKLRPIPFPEKIKERLL